MSKEYTAFNGDAFWNDGYVQELDLAETAVYFHYITSPRLENSGVYKEAQRMVSFYTKTDLESVKNIDAKLGKDGKVYRIGEWVMVPSSLKHQKFDRSPNVIKGIYEQLKTAPLAVLKKLQECGYTFDLTSIISESDKTPNSFKVLSEPLANPSGTLPEPLANPSGTLPEPLANPSGTLPLYLDIDRDIDRDIDQKKEEEEVESTFSLSEELHPSQKDLTTRILAHEKTWNESGASPPCELIVFSPLQIQDMSPVLRSYSDERIDKAIRNYAEIFKSGKLEGKPCSSFVNFLIRWVERFVDEAEPFLRATIPKRAAQAAARHEESFD